MTDQTATLEAPKVTETEKSMGQTYHEEVEALKASGVSNAEAVRQVAEQHGKPISAVRGGIYQHKTRLENGGSPIRGSRRPTGSVDECVRQARASLAKALGMIDGEVQVARQSFEDAKANYEQVQASAKDRRADIEQKLKAFGVVITTKTSVTEKGVR